jgi:hypothetical protein
MPRLDGARSRRCFGSRMGSVLVCIPPDIQRIEQNIALLKCNKISISCFSGMAVILANHNLLEGAEERT